MRSGLLLLSTLLLNLQSLVQSVDRGNFKTCEDSGFCKRLRNNGAQGSNSFEMEHSSLNIGQDSIVGTLININNQVRFHLELWAIKDQMFRFKIKEAYPLRERFQPPEVLVSEPEVAGLKTQIQTAEMIELATLDEKSAVKVFFKPFKMEFYSSGEHVFTANGRGKLVYEETKAHDGLNESFKGHTDSMPHGPQGIGMDFTFEDTKHVYGLPEHTDGLSLKDTASGDPYRMYNLDVFEYELNERMALYASIPYMMSHSAKRSTGLFWLNAAETWVDISHGSGGILGALSDMVTGGETPNVDTTWISESGIIDAFVLLGPTPKDVSKQFVTLTGATSLPPFFSLGYHQCRWNYRDEADVAEVNANMDVHDIPNDVIWLDIEHTDGKRYFTWDKNKFQHPEQMIAGLTAVGRKLVNIVDPHVKVDSSYYIYQECKDQDLFVKDKSGNEYNGWCWPGNSAYSDFLNPKARNYYADQYKVEKYEGTSNDLHIWNDMNEPSVFNGPEVTMQKDNLHFGNVEHRDMHNIYGHLYTMATHEGILRRSGSTLRPFVLTRSAFAGTQRYAAIWTGDNTAAWDHLEASIPMCLSLSIAGMTFVGADVGGFFGNPDAELMIRWYQAAVFQPFFRSHAHLDTKRREPWVFGEENMKFMRAAIKTRYTILPLWYTLFFESEMKTGAPPMRPLFYEFPGLEEVYDIDSEHMVGDALLVAPVTKSGVQSWDIYLPPSAIWYELSSGKKMSMTGKFTIPVDMNTVPVFHRGGTIIPTLQRPRRSTSIMLNDPYTLTIALDDQRSAKGSLYIDDGKTFEYKSGKFNYISLAFNNNILEADNENVYSTSAWLESIRILGYPAKPKSIKLGDSELGFKFDPRLNILSIRKPGVNLSERKWKLAITV